MERVLIAGCGRIGTQLGIKLSDAGHTVYAICRSSTLPSPLHTINADLCTLEKFTQPFDYVIYTGSADSYSKDAYKAAYFDGLKNLITCLPEKPKKFIYTSSTAVYGQHQGEWVDEESEANPSGFAGEYLLEGEQFLQSQDFASAVVRFSGIYGPEHNSLLQQVLDRKVQLTATPHYTNRIHSVDCVRLLEYLLKTETQENLFIGTDELPVEKNHLIHWLEDQLSLPQTETLSKQVSKRGNKRCYNQRLLSAGFNFIYPTYEIGYQTLITASAST